MIYSREKALKAAKLTLILKTGAQILGILVTILLVKLLSEEEYGVYNTFIASITVIGSILSFGIGNTLQRYVPKYFKENEFILAKKIINIAFWLRLVSLTVVCMIGYWSRETITGWMNISAYADLVALFICIVLLHFQTRLLSTVLSACLMQGVNQVAQITLVSSKAILYSYFLINGYELSHVFVADIASYCLMLLVVIVGYFRFVKPLTGGRNLFEKKEKKKIIKYAAYNNLNDVGLISLGRDIDVLFIASMVDIVSAGAYAFANRIAHVLRQISPVSYFIDVIRPMFFTLDRAEDKDKVGFYFNLLLKMNYLFELPMICGVYLFYPFLIEWFFDGKYADYQILVTLVFTIVCCSSFGIYVGLVAQLRERADIIFYSKFFAIVNVVGNLALIPVVGVFGAVVSTLVSTVAKDIFVYYFVKGDIRIKPFVVFLLLSTLYWACIAATGIVLLESFGYSIITFVMQIFICISAYVIFISLSLFSETEKEFLMNVTQNKKNRLKIIGV